MDAFNTFCRFSSVSSIPKDSGETGGEIPMVKELVEADKHNTTGIIREQLNAKFS